MKLSDYQNEVKNTAIYPNQGNNISYAVLGLTGEVGEVADKVKKIIRDNNGIIDAQKREELIKELGDAFWYLATLATELNTTLEEVAEKNILKIRDRKHRGVLHGEGDNR